MQGISFIITAYNRPESLKISLDSLSAQFLHPQQIIIIDDMSTNESAIRNKTIAESFNAEYYYHRHSPKKYRRTECNNKGLQYVKNDVVCFSITDFLYEPYYTKQCYDLVIQYENMALNTLNYNLPFPEFYQTLLSKGYSLMEIVKQTQDYKNHEQEYKDSAFLSYSRDPKPTREGFYWDSASWMLTKNAIENKVWDSDIVGWGNDQSDCINNLLLHGMALVVLKDVWTYHIQHHKDDYTEGYNEGRELLNKKWKEIKIPLFNDLVRRQNG